ncbi:hypothetical protein VTN00DRAFT_8972 [Thermoascus crustaceus]|uniref:uncharacterized protein n=1 Tax=Thermoascus crustaceus TaxID=5088 RepID=UPI00374428D1
MNTAKITTSTIIPASFLSRKRKILADLSVPDAEYTDLSPKGSVDEGIRDLIRDVNGLEGLVTTSSCAGRVSVFLEGQKRGRTRKQTQNAPPSDVKKNDDEDGEDHREDDDGDTEQQERMGTKFASAGGKGGGRWLYVSHDPVTVPARDAEGRCESSSLHALFGMVPGDVKPKRKHDDDGDEGQGLRLVRFRFEPMILHIMAATLKHAQPVLTAASSAGFRESGLQSLRCLDDDNDDDTSPIIVAVRSSGLSLESIVGYCDGEDGNGEPIIRSLVTEEYLRMLVGIANERFEVNADRVERFQTKLMELFSVPQAAQSGSKGKGKGKVKSRPAGWEDPEARRERKRAEGLRRKELEARRHEEEIGAGDGHNNNNDDGFGPIWEAPS